MGAALAALRDGAEQALALGDLPASRAFRPPGF
jgi:hypothetical protein